MNTKEDILGMYRNISKYAIDIINDMYDEIGEEEIEESNSVSYYTVNRIPKLFESIKKEMKEVDFTQFNQDELKQLGFNLWDDDHVLMLAPKWVFRVMKPGTELTSISGETKVFGIDKIDMDTRFGVTAWGLTKSQIRDQKIESFLNDTEKTD